jgi:outer membrane biosynthesis protein TonB
VAQPEVFDDILDIPLDAVEDTNVAPPIDPELGREATSEPAMLALPIEPTSDAAPVRDASKAKLATDNVAAQQVWGGDSNANSNLVAARAPRAGLAALLQNKRNLGIAGGAVALLVVVVVFAMSGGDSTPANKPPTATGRDSKAAQHVPNETSNDTEQRVAQPSETPSESPTSEPPTRVTTGGGNAMTTTPSETPAEPPPTETPTEAPPTETPPVVTEPKPPVVAQPKPKKPKALGGKKVVLEYDNQTRDTKPVADAPQADQAAISKARTSYAAGNTRLFAGDPDGAILNYRQALSYYPAYIAGYRGLGLAYAQKRDKANAIKALNTYLGAVPNAKDAALIRKRIETLSK